MSRIYICKWSNKEENGTCSYNGVSLCNFHRTATDIIWFWMFVSSSLFVGSLLILNNKKKSHSRKYRSGFYLKRSSFDISFFFLLLWSNQFLLNKRSFSTFKPFNDFEYNFLRTYANLTSICPNLNQNCLHKITIKNIFLSLIVLTVALWQ